MAELILNSLQIENYRLLESLTIPRLGRVNLITGKNNVGKTSLLEALRIYADRATPRTLIECSACEPAEQSSRSPCAAWVTASTGRWG